MRAIFACLAVLLAAGVAHADPLDDLVRAYPDELVGIDGNELIWRDGTRMPISDGRPDKSEAEALRSGSIADQIRTPYSIEMPPTEDPGRVRNKAFFDKMYGDCRSGQVAPRLVRVTWLPQSWGHSVSITSVNGADHALEAVSHELDSLPEPLKRYLTPLGGTYLCRNVADTGQTSMHGWGAAIDLNVSFSDYWLWQRRGSSAPAYRNRIPSEIVDIFERHGFIWGGRWAHYDTMHFEYRPELLVGQGAGRPPR